MKPIKDCEFDDCSYCENATPETDSESEIDNEPEEIQK